MMVVPMRHPKLLRVHLKKCLSIWSSHKKNQGLAAALNTGLRTAIESGREGDIIITMDADDTHPPKIIDRLITVLDEGLDVAVASRYQAGARVIGVPWNRIFLAQVASAMFRLLMPLPGIRDYTCGYRAYKYEALRETIDFYGDEFVSEAGFSLYGRRAIEDAPIQICDGRSPLDSSLRSKGRRKQDAGRQHDFQNSGIVCQATFRWLLIVTPEEKTKRTLICNFVTSSNVVV